MNPTRKCACCLLLLLVAILNASAQKRPGDARPLSGFDASAVPAYSSVQSFLQAQSRSTLLSAARVVDRTQKTTITTSMQSVNTKSFQSGNPQLKIYRSPNGSIRWLEGELMSPVHGGALGKQGGTAAQRAMAVLKSQSALLRLVDPQEELTVMSATRDELSYEHVRFQQIYKGIPVWGRDLYVHFNSQGVAYLVNGIYEPSPLGIETTPTTSPDDALETAVNDLRAKNRYQPLTEEAMSLLHIEGPTEELILYPMVQGGFRLAYQVNIHPNLVEWYSYIVDARDGEILNTIARHCSLLPDGESSRSITSGETRFGMPNVSSGLAGSFIDATGKDLNNVNRSLRVWHDASGGNYLVWDLPNLSPTSGLPGNPTGGGATVSAKNQDLASSTKLYFDVSVDNSWSDPSAVSAHYNMKVAYDYYSAKHSRNAIDGKGATIWSILHVTDKGKGMDNAYWNGASMAYGDGDVYFKPLAGGLDVSGHEMTHGVIQASANLTYQNQSGALNESFADVFGVFIDPSNYLIGDNIVKPSTGKVALRDLSNPKSPEVLSVQPASMSEFRTMAVSDDNGGVHINSGIPNKAAFHIINAIGRIKAELIYYRALTKYLTRSSQFADCRQALEQAAKDLKGTAGIGDSDVAAVKTAFDAVGITTTTGSLRGSWGNEVQPVSGGTQHIAFMTSTGQIGLCNPVTGQAALFTSTNAVARTSSGDYSQLSTGMNGERIWFINQSGQLANIEVVTGAVSTFPQVYLQQPGDLWNASVSPDEAYIILVSAYAKDPNLYLYNGQQMGRIHLDPEGTQEGIKVQTIQYPDVVSWSSNMKFPKIGFDAYNELGIGDSSKVGYWSMYELDLPVEKIYNLIGSQPRDVSIGNIAYSNTNPDLLAFNYLDPAGKLDVYVGNFDTGELNALNLPSLSLGGSAIGDAERPTFSPDDSKICFTSRSRNSLLFFDRQSGQITYLTFLTALYNPRWFVQGGKILSRVETAEVPTAFQLFENYPNPFNPTTRIDYALPTKTQVQLSVYDLLGRLVRKLVDAELPAGRFSTTWNGTDDFGAQLASGLYIYRLEAADGVGKSIVLSKKMLFLK